MLAKITPIFMLAFLCCQLTVLHAEAVEDDVLFHIECPDDVTVDCDVDVWDLSPYGWAYVYGYGAPVPAGDPVVSYHLNSCGTGHIARTWTAYDYSNTAFTCTQYIYVGGGSFSGYNIHWPPNYMTDDCNANLHPDHLPAPFNYPTYDNVDCSMIMIGYDDLVFDFGGGCKKILRTWSLLDWCTYNPNYPHGPGRWDYTQVLKIKPAGDLLLDCPDDITASAGANCSGTYVSIPPATGTGACGSTVSVTNNSPYATSGGADASGHYPYGVTWVTFFAEDACGNWESCKIKVTVKDMKKPSPICYNGLTANLMLNPDGYYIDLDPKWFNKGSFDNCTPDHLLQFRIEPSRFTCDDLGEQPVKVFVKDQDGNEQYCNTYVIIQDNMGMCPPMDTSNFTLSGTISNLQGLPLAEMNLDLMENGDILAEVESASNGHYQFSRVMNNGDYMIKPNGNQDYALGLSTFDLLKLAKHVHGIKDLESNGERFAADANQDGEVNVQDLLVLSRFLLNYTTTFPNGKAWRFIPTELLDDDDDMLDDNIQEYWTIEDLYEDIDEIDFTAIKIGDINGSVQSLGGAHPRSARPTFTIETRRTGNEIQFISTQALKVSGLQFELNNLPVEQIQPGALNINMANMHSLATKNIFSWYDAEQSQEVNKGDILFTLILGSVHDNATFATDGLQPEIYSGGEVIYDLTLRPSASVPAISSEQEDFIVNFYPNPAARGNQINIVSEVHAIKSISVYDTRGQIQFQIDGQTSNEVGIETNNLSGGLYLIQVESVTGLSTYLKAMLKE